MLLLLHFYSNVLKHHVPFVWFTVAQEKQTFYSHQPQKRSGVSISLLSNVLMLVLLFSTICRLDATEKELVPDAALAAIISNLIFFFLFLF